MSPNPACTIGFLVACLLWAAQVVAAGASAGDLVARGNAAYAEGRFDEALSLYDEASVTMPESPRLYFNRGTVRYRMEDYAAATEDFKEAAVRAKEPVLTSRAKYNLGNCAFRAAQRQRDSDLKKAIAHCEESIAYYQEARDLDPEYREAAENIEIVRLYVKVLLDEQQKKEEQEQQQQEEQENLVQKLQKLIARQQGLIGRNEGLRTSLPDALDARSLEGWRKDLESLVTDQGTLRTDTGAVLDEMRQTAAQLQQQAASAGGAPGSAPQPAAPDATAFAEKVEVAAGHVVNAMAEEEQAEGTLASARQDAALGHQANAVQDLTEAVKALADEQEQQDQQQSGDQNQDQQDQQQEGEEEQQENQSDNEQEQDAEDGQEREQEQNEEDGQEKEEGEQQGQDNEDAQQQEMEARAEQVDDILDEEKENQKQRRPVQPGRVRPVDKDW